MDFLKKLPTPQEVMLKYPLNKEYSKRKILRDKEIRDIFEGKSDKFILVIGPCSADRENVVLDYAKRLAKLQEEVKDTILIIPRIYTSKPRTIGDGYKGLLHQPFLDREEDIVEGLLAVRRLHKKVIEETGLFGADEMLYPEVIRYVSDLLSYVVVGARSVENQQHRLTASGLNGLAQKYMNQRRMEFIICRITFLSLERMMNNGRSGNNRRHSFGWLYFGQSEAAAI